MEYLIRDDILVKYTEQREKKQVVIPDEIREIGEKAFSKCTSLTKIDIPKSVSLVEREAFSGCTSLYGVTMKARNEAASLVFEDNVFSGCTGIKEIEFVEGVERIGSSALEGCENLDTIILPKSMKKMGEKAFNGCGNIRHIWFRGNAREWKELVSRANSISAFTGSILTDWDVQLNQFDLPNRQDIIKLGYSG